MSKVTPLDPDARQKAKDQIKAQVAGQVQAEQEDIMPGRVVTSATALMARTFVDRPIVGGLLDERESLVIVGQTNLGKSLLALMVALWLASPIRPLWGKFNALKPIKTLFVQSENSAKGTQKRLRLMLEANPALRASLDSIFFAGAECRITGSFLDPEFLANIEAMISETEAELLVIDPLISFHGAADENDNSAIRRSLDQLTALQDRTNTASVLVHNSGKSQHDDPIFAGRGATAIPDWADNILVLSRDKKQKSGEGSAIIEVVHPKSRNFAKSDPWWLERTSNLDFLRIDRPGETKELDHAQAVVKALQGLGGRANKQKDLEAAVQVALNCQNTEARRAIRAAQERLLIVATPSETDGRVVGFTLPGWEGAKKRHAAK